MTDRPVADLDSKLATIDAMLGQAERELITVEDAPAAARRAHMAFAEQLGDEAVRAAAIKVELLRECRAWSRCGRGQELPVEPGKAAANDRGAAAGIDGAPAAERPSAGSGARR